VEKQARVLLIDDDPDFVAATKIVLESKPFQVITALDGDEGLKKAREQKPDVIILDVIMPTKDGFDVCVQLKKEPELADIPVIMLTSFAQRVGDTSISVGKGLTIEADDYIDKPVNPNELIRRVERLLKKAD
jgi:two-component system alkaline phosphatase synthesis response regulator PhoP